MKLDHVQLAMPPGAEDTAREFFSGILGMVEEEKPDALAGRGGCWFRSNSLVLHIGVDNDFRPQKKAHPAICVADIDQLASKLQEHRIPVVRDDSLPDRMRFYSEDPFGNRIEFIQDGDGFLQK